MYTHQAYSASQTSGSSSRMPTPRPSQPGAAPANSNILLLKFAPRSRTGPARSVLNCTVVGADGYTPYYHIMSDASEGGSPGDITTVLRTNAGRTVATIDWSGGTAHVQVHNALARTRVSQWLAVSPDGSYRSMLAMGQQYAWLPQPNAICMYHTPSASHTHIPPNPRLVARIAKVTDQNQDRFELTLEVEAASASTSGLLTIIVLATTLFHSECSLN